MLSILAVDTGITSSLLGYVGDVWSDFYLLAVLAIGLPLGFWVVRKVISLVRAR
jgi:hypothetical protein